MHAKFLVILLTFCNSVLVIVNGHDGLILHGWSYRVGANKVWGRMVPAFKGLGYGMLLVRWIRFHAVSLLWYMIRNMTKLFILRSTRFGSTWTSTTWWSAPGRSITLQWALGRTSCGNTAGGNHGNHGEWWYWLRQNCDNIVAKNSFSQ